jgi:hypothetical protein
MNNDFRESLGLVPPKSTITGMLANLPASTPRSTFVKSGLVKCATFIPTTYSLLANAALAAIEKKKSPMYALLPELNELPKNILDDEQAGNFVGGSRFVLAMRVVKSKDVMQWNTFVQDNCEATGGNYNTATSKCLRTKQADCVALGGQWVSGNCTKL